MNKNFKGVICLNFFIILFNISWGQTINESIYNEIRLNSYSSDEDFSIYVDKFYRDLAFYGIYTVKPKNIIIKFSNLNSLKITTHMHGVSFGQNDESKIEIYINPSSWNKFNKPKRYYLMYHELAHDILDLEDLEAIPQNKGKLMYPELWEFEQMSMDDFIEISKAFFEELSNS